MNAMKDSQAVTLAHASLSVDGGDLPLSIARGARGDLDRRAVIIFPSAFGVPPDLEEQMKELATEASAVVAIDPFFRHDGGAIVPYDDTPRAIARLGAIELDRADRDTRSAVAWMKRELSARSIVALGICFGGTLAMRAALDGDGSSGLDGVVTWHGTRMEQQLLCASEMRCPMRLHFGAVDPFVPPAAVDAVRAAFAGRDDVRIVVHEGATHGFSHRGAPRAYDARAERAGMASLFELIERPTERR